MFDLDTVETAEKFKKFMETAGRLSLELAEARGTKELTNTENEFIEIFIEFNLKLMLQLCKRKNQQN